jgi:plasmid stabilization system protein ParE
MSFVVELSPAAETDLGRLFGHLLGRADTTEAPDRAQSAIDVIRDTMQRQLATAPFSFRKAARSPVQRELIMPFGGSGYLALYEIVSPSKVAQLAVRHQCEEDYH